MRVGTLAAAPAVFVGLVATSPIAPITPATPQASIIVRPGVIRVTGYRARRGYNLATGLGTVTAPYFVPELARVAGH